MDVFDVIVIGAGAAGMMCAAQAGQRGRRVLVLEHTAKAGEKIRISGGGRCNFTNRHCGPDKFASSNPHFCKSALKRYTPHDFIALVERYGIGWHEKNPETGSGQLFCDKSATQIVDMLRAECERGRVDFRFETKAVSIDKQESVFSLRTEDTEFACEKLVLASGGPSIPKIGGSNFAFRIARQFGLDVIPPEAALVPLTFTDEMRETTRALSGVAVDPVTVRAEDGTTFRDALLFTHRGLSGPAILQISSYWRPGQTVTVDLLPDTPVHGIVAAARRDQPRQMLHTILSRHLPARLAEHLVRQAGGDRKIAELPRKSVETLETLAHHWQVRPNGTEGYRTAEVARGGVDTNEMSSKTFETKKVPGLYIIGEALDVTGHLGGHNFQWAWSSGWCCGQSL